MKVLMARVSEKIGGLPKARPREGDDAREEDEEMSEERKLKAILERPPPVISRGE